MDIRERLVENRKRLQGIQSQLQTLEQKKQELLQELLRLDGEGRLLDELQKEIKLTGMKEV